MVPDLVPTFFVIVRNSTCNISNMTKPFRLARSNTNSTFYLQGKNTSNKPKYLSAETVNFTVQLELERDTFRHNILNIMVINNF